MARGLWALLFLAACRGGPLPPAPPAPPAEDPEIAALVRLLGDDDVALRERAEEDLERLGARAGRALVGACRDSDAEVAARARRLMDRLFGSQEAAYWRGERLGIEIQAARSPSPFGAQQVLDLLQQIEIRVEGGGDSVVGAIDGAGLLAPAWALVERWAGARVEGAERLHLGVSWPGSEALRLYPFLAAALMRRGLDLYMAGEGRLRIGTAGEGARAVLGDLHAGLRDAFRHDERDPDRY